ncbi:hypothetical protein SOPP22_10740 [Shewanella sp. OPT22]|nr:hypothetical protein SOPP22_10740 [Shewanella sp. OPT22]
MKLKALEVTIMSTSSAHISHNASCYYNKILAKNAADDFSQLDKYEPQAFKVEETDYTLCFPCDKQRLLEAMDAVELFYKKASNMDDLQKADLLDDYADYKLQQYHTHLCHLTCKIVSESGRSELRENYLSSYKAFMSDLDEIAKDPSEEMKKFGKLPSMLAFAFEKSSEAIEVAGVESGEENEAVACYHNSPELNRKGSHYPNQYYVSTIKSS